MQVQKGRNQKRLGEALNEIRLIGEYDYYLVNDSVDRAAARIRSIMEAEASRVPKAVKTIIKAYEKETK